MIGNLRFSEHSLSYAILKALLIFPLLSSMPAYAQDSAWKEIETHRFGFFESLQRSQGLTTDQKGNIWYSSNYTLIRCQDWIRCTRASNTDAIPEELKRLGENHIGDIENVGSFIFAPIEDGPKYQRPFVGVYTADTLELVKKIELSRDWLPDGIPWITVDLYHQLLITAQYHQTTRINLYNMRTGAPFMQIPLSMTLDSIQGGKYFNNHLYMTANDPDGGHAVFDMSLWTGEVQKIIHLNDEIGEVEGLTYLVDPKSPAENPSISDLFVLGVAGSGLNKRMVLYHWKR